MIYRNGMPFAFWCHKVLPLVYDESLSYYEFLCKLSKILQEVMEHDVEQDETIQKCVDDIQTLSEDIHGINQRIEDIIEHDNQQDENLQELEEDLANFHHEVGEQIGDIEERIRGILIELGNLGDEIAKVAHNIADEYNEETMYGLGAVVVHNNQLYICENGAVPVGEFDPSYWRAITVDDVYTRHTEFVNITNLIWIAIAPEFQNYDGSSFTYEKGTVVRYMTKLYVVNNDIVVDHVIDEPPFNIDFTETDISTQLSKHFETITKTKNNIASEYDSDIVYNLGDYCMFYDVLYKCKDNNVTGSFDFDKWDAVQVTNELGQGSGGSGNVSVPAYDANSWYWKFDFVEYNGTVYMCKATNTSGAFSPSDWVALEPNYLTTGAYRALGADYGEWHGDAVKGEVTIYRDATTGKISLWKCNVANASVPFDSSEFRVTDLVTEHNMLSNLTSGYRVETYDSAKTYNKGDIVIDSRGLCEKCKEDGVTGTWDGTKWDDTNMFEVLASIVKTLNNLNLYNGNLVDRFSTNVTEVI